jgi:hypothetical protein
MKREASWPARAGGLLAAAAVAALLAAPQAAADRGVALDIGQIDIEQALVPGGSYRLPAFGVRNPGDERTSYLLKVWPIRGGGRAPDPRWVRFSPVRLTLRPNRIMRIQVRIVLPADAAPGDYAALIGPEIVGTGGGASVGGAAAARLTFTVESSSTLESWWRRLKNFLGDHMPWTLVVPAAVLAGLLAEALRRRYRFAIVRRP